MSDPIITSEGACTSDPTIKPLVPWQIQWPPPYFQGEVREIRVIDPVTGGAKGEKPEDFSQVPPIPLARTIAEMAHSKDTGSPEICFSRFLSGKSREYLITAAVKAALKMKSDGFQDPLGAVARVYRMGGEKYSKGNWLKGYEWRLSISAAWRHINLYYFSELNDAESSEPHLAHAIFHFFGLYEFDRLGLGTDDRLFVEGKGVA